jgi:hypothetical protein
MAGFKPSETGFDRAGLLALLLATATLGTEMVLFVTVRTPPGIALLLILLFFSLASIFILFRFQVPDIVRLPMTALLILALLVMGLRADPFGISTGRDDVSGASGPVRQGVATAAGKTPSQDEPDAPMKSDGEVRSHPKIALNPDPEGDRGWAARINDDVAKSIAMPGASDLLIEGSVVSSSEEADERVMIVWSLQSGDKWISCGSTTAMSRNQGLILDQIKHVFGKAIEESVKRGQPTCF